MVTAPPPSEGPMSLLFDVWLVAGISSGYLDDVLADTDLNGDDFGLYALLHRFGPITATQLRRWTGLPLTTVSAQLRRVERRGHLERLANPHDKRSHLVGLNALGDKVYADATEPFLRAMHQLRPRFVPDTLRERLVLQHIDTVLRDTTGLDPRPYQVTLDDVSTAAEHDRAGTQALAYHGAPLSPSQEHQVRLYIDFIRSQQPTE
jgi:DNA-binding MarR family transcriptional regulator